MPSEDLVPFLSSMFIGWLLRLRGRAMHPPALAFVSLCDRKGFVHIVRFQPASDLFLGGCFGVCYENCHGMFSGSFLRYVDFVIISHGFS